MSWYVRWVVLPVGLAIRTPPTLRYLPVPPATGSAAEPGERATIQPVHRGRAPQPDTAEIGIHILPARRSFDARRLKEDSGPLIALTRGPLLR